MTNETTKQLRASLAANDTQRDLRESIEGRGPGRPPLYELAMTPAQRQARRRTAFRESIHAEADIAGEHIAEVRRELARVIGGSTADDKLLRAIDALDRIRDIVRR